MLNFNGLSSVNTSLSVKYNKTLNALTLHTALGESVVTNIALCFMLYAIATPPSPQAVYFIQTGGSALSNTY